MRSFIAFVFSLALAALSLIIYLFYENWSWGELTPLAMIPLLALLVIGFVYTAEAVAYCLEHMPKSESEDTAR